jgi:hypothetical protein
MNRGTLVKNPDSPLCRPGIAGTLINQDLQ